VLFRSPQNPKTPIIASLKRKSRNVNLLTLNYNRDLFRIFFVSLAVMLQNCMKLIMRSWNKMMPDKLVEWARLQVDINLLSFPSWLAKVAVSETPNTVLQNNLQGSIISSWGHPRGQSIWVHCLGMRFRGSRRKLGGYDAFWWWRDEVHKLGCLGQANDLVLRKKGWMDLVRL
jgi:hypothetical protein